MSPVAESPASGPAVGLPAPVDDAHPRPPSLPHHTAPLDPGLNEIMQFIEQRKTGIARIRLRKFMNLHPDHAQAQFLFGLTYHREKKYASARTYFERARKLDPHYDPAHYFLGWCLYYLGEIDDARDAFLIHLEYQPESVDTHFALGLTDLDADRLDDASRRFRRSIMLTRNRPGTAAQRSKAHARLADVAIRLDDHDEAKRQLLIATDLEPEHYEAFYKLFTVYMRLGEPELAESARRQFETVRARRYPGTE